MTNIVDIIKSLTPETLKNIINVSSTVLLLIQEESKVVTDKKFRIEIEKREKKISIEREDLIEETSFFDEIETPSFFVYECDIVNEPFISLNLKDLVKIIRSTREKIKKKYEKFFKTNYIKLYNSITDLLLIPWKEEIKIIYWAREKEGSFIVFKKIPISVEKYRIELEITHTIGEDVRTLKLVFIENIISSTYFIRKSPKTLVEYDISSKTIKVEYNYANLPIDLLVKAVLNGFPEDLISRCEERIYKAIKYCTLTIKDLVLLVLTVNEFMNEILRKREEFDFVIKKLAFY